MKASSIIQFTCKPRPSDEVSSGSSLGLVLLGKDIITKTEKENESISSVH